MAFDPNSFDPFVGTPWVPRWVPLALRLSQPAWPTRLLEHYAGSHGGFMTLTDSIALGIAISAARCDEHEIATDQRATEAQKDTPIMTSKSTAVLTVVPGPVPDTKPDYDVPRFPVGTVADGRVYSAVPLQDGGVAYIWSLVSPPRGEPTQADRIAELKAEIDRLRESFDSEESQSSFDAWKSAEKALEFETARAEREQIRKAKHRALVEAPEYRAQLADIDAVERECRQAYEALLAEQIATMVLAADIATRAASVADRAYFAAERRNMLRRTAGERVPMHTHSVVSMGTFAREVQIRLVDHYRARGMSAPDLTRLVGG